MSRPSAGSPSVPTRPASRRCARRSSQGTFLREEALRRWQSFVGADQMTRFFSEGIGRIRGALAAVFRPATAPVAEIRAATTDDLLAIARLEAARRPGGRRRRGLRTPACGSAVAEDAELWLPSADFEAACRNASKAGWRASSRTSRHDGRSKRTLARGASVGVNVLGTSVMLGTFLHTGGLTGAEVGVVAATAFLNQKLLSALFGEAAMVELIEAAKRRLEDALATTFEEERSRFDRLLPATEELPQLARELRLAAADASRPADHRLLKVATSGVLEAALEGADDPLRACLAGLLEAADAADGSGAGHQCGAGGPRRRRERPGFPGNAYVLAFVGGTGVGKSSLLNGLAGAAVSAASVRRPTTTSPIAWVPAAERAALVPLLAWIGVEDVREHAGPDLGTVAILDLPDMDSVAAEHRARVEAILPRVDAVAWITDPEKYHDAALHDDFLARVAAPTGSPGRRPQQGRPPIRR